MNIRKLLASAAGNWPAKALSVALAIVLFMFNRLSTLEERFFSVPLDIEVKGNLIPSESYPRMIRVRLRGEANSIHPILENDIETYIDLGRFTAPGNYRTEVQVRKKGTALGVQFLEIGVEPMDIDLSLDYKISKFVPLSANLRGNVDSGYVLTSHSLSPTQVIIDGPSRLIGSISELSTDFVDLDGRNEDFTVMVNILNPNPLIVIRGNGFTEFRGLISKIIPVRNIQDIPISISGLPADLSAGLSVKTGSVHLEGASQEELDRFILPRNFLDVDCSGIEEPGTYTLEVKASSVPRGLILNYEPREVTIVVEGTE